MLPKRPHTEYLLYFFHLWLCVRIYVCLSFVVPQRRHATTLSRYYVCSRQVRRSQALVVILQCHVRALDLDI